MNRARHGSFHFLLYIFCKEFSSIGKLKISHSHLTRARPLSFVFKDGKKVV